VRGKLRSRLQTMAYAGPNNGLNDEFIRRNFKGVKGTSDSEG